MSYSITIFTVDAEVPPLFLSIARQNYKSGVPSDRVDPTPTLFQMITYSSGLPVFLVTMKLKCVRHPHFETFQFLYFSIFIFIFQFLQDSTLCTRSPF